MSYSVWAAIKKNTIEWWFKNNRNLFLTVLDAGKSKIRVLEDLMSGVNLLPGS